MSEWIRGFNLGVAGAVFTCGVTALTLLWTEPRTVPGLLVIWCVLGGLGMWRYWPK